MICNENGIIKFNNIKYNVSSQKIRFFILQETSDKRNLPLVLRHKISESIIIRNLRSSLFSFHFNHIATSTMNQSRENRRLPYDHHSQRVIILLTSKIRIEIIDHILYIRRMKAAVTCQFAAGTLECVLVAFYPNKRAVIRR